MKSLGGHFILMIISLLKQKAVIFLIYDKKYISYWQYNVV